MDKIYQIITNLLLVLMKLVGVAIIVGVIITLFYIQLILN
jgi:hypothetical protein